MELNKKELKKIMHSFNTISSRMMRVNWSEYHMVLSKFLAFIDGNQIILDYVNMGVDEEFDAAIEYKEVTGSNGRLVFSFGPSIEQETYQIYMLLKYICETEAMIWHGLRMQYGKSNFQEIVKEFNDRVVLVMISNINDFLTRIGIDMGIDENVIFNVNGGQVNVANDYATINATQNNGVSVADIEDIIKNIFDNISGINSEDAATIVDAVEMIKDEMLKPEPKTRNISNGIKLLAPMIAIANGAPTLVKNIKALIDMAMTYIN